MASVVAPSLISSAFPSWETSETVQLARAHNALAQTTSTEMPSREAVGQKFARLIGNAYRDREARLRNPEAKWSKVIPADQKTVKANLDQALDLVRDGEYLEDASIRRTFKPDAKRGTILARHDTSLALAKLAQPKAREQNQDYDLFLNALLPEFARAALELTIDVAIKACNLNRGAKGSRERLETRTRLKELKSYFAAAAHWGREHGQWLAAYPAGAKHTREVEQTVSTFEREIFLAKQLGTGGVSMEEHLKQPCEALLKIADNNPWLQQLIGELKGVQGCYAIASAWRALTPVERLGLMNELDSQKPHDRHKAPPPAGDAVPG